MSGIGGMPVRTKDGTWYTSSIRFKDVKHAVHKGPINYNGNPNASTTFSPNAYAWFLKNGARPRRLHARYKLKDQNHYSYMIR